MSRSSRPELQYQPEIEKFAKALRKEAKEREGQKLLESQSALFSQTETFYESDSSARETETESNSEEAVELEVEFNLVAITEGDMADPILNELSSHLEDDPPTPIKLADSETPIEIKLGLLNVLPKFYGKKGDDPYNFLSEFVKICKVQKRPTGISEEQFKLAAFPFTQTAEANVWFTSLPPNSISTWADMKKSFLEHFFPATKTHALKKEISGIKQDYDESLSMYWSRFQRLLDTCPNHKYTEGDLLQYFYQGMTVDTKNFVNSSSGGDFSRRRVSEAKNIIQSLVDATREYEEPRVTSYKKVAQASSSKFEEKFEERMGRMEQLLSNVVDKVAIVEKAAIVGQPANPCGVCGNFGHTSLQCGRDDEGLYAQANASHNFYSCNDPPAKRDPYSNTYNPGWRDHPNFRWRDSAQKQPQQQQPQ